MTTRYLNGRTILRLLIVCGSLFTAAAELSAQYILRLDSSLSGSGVTLWESGRSAFRTSNNGMATIPWGSAAFGGTVASADYSFVASLGTASDYGATAFGGGSALGYLSFAAGDEALASGDFSTALGPGAHAGGDSSVALGLWTNAPTYASVAIGRLNLGGGGSNSNLEWYPGDPVFEIGIGTPAVPGGQAAIRANALTVFKNGNTVLYGTNNTMPNQALGGNSAAILNVGLADARYLKLGIEGSVGIGTPIPGARLEVSIPGTGVTSIFGRGADPSFTLSASQSKVSNDAGAVVGQMGLAYTYGAHYDNAAVRFHRGGWYYGGFLTFTTNDGSEKMRIDPAGNVGIGTDNPAAKLDVSNGWITPQSNVGMNTYENAGFTWYTPQPTHYGIYRTAGGWDDPAYQQLKINFDTGIQLGAGAPDGTNYAKSYVEVVSGKGLMVTSGNVGVGTTTPEAKLHVVGDAKFSGVVRVAPGGDIPMLGQ